MRGGQQALDLLLIGRRTLVGKEGIHHGFDKLSKAFDTFDALFGLFAITFDVGVFRNAALQFFITWN
jgi:hypothetical protein